MKKKKRNDFEEEEYIKSKTQIKDEMLELQAFGKSISDLPKSVYKSFEIPEQLDEAIQTLKRIKNWNAQKRQFQYIGKILREMDEEKIQRLRIAFRDFENGRKKFNREFTQLEAIRDALIGGDKDALSKLLDDYPNIERQPLMQLIRAAQKETSTNESLKPGQIKVDKNYKKLFQFLKVGIKAGIEGSAE
ncbi:MAG: DUF615 domain-containing protein [Sinobacterium sp.]|nr:DUF615 domain-containing protein [Sinobacterium sp.]